MYYTLIMCANPEDYQGPQIEFPASRVFEYTKDDIVSHFTNEDNSLNDEFFKHPAILAYESINRTDAKLVEITKIRQRQNEVRFTVEPIDNQPSISWQQLEDMSWDLDIEPFEFSRTHISVKKVDVFEELKALDKADLSKSEIVAIDPGANTEHEMKSVFICYSHTDSKQLSRLLVHLKPLKKMLDISSWSDQNINASSTWKDDILDSLNAASAVILLVSADFLASDFINDTELPRILERREQEEIPVFPVLLKPSLFTKRTDLAVIQAVNSPSETIVEMNEGDAERVWVRLSESISRLI